MAKKPVIKKTIAKVVKKAPLVKMTMKKTVLSKSKIK